MGALVVDWGARTISGLAVPYGPAARVGGRRYRFLPGWALHDGPVKLLRDHDNSQRVGRVALADCPTGLLAVATVKRGRRGDRVLAIAGRLGFSVGVEWRELLPDPADPRVRLVVAAWLNEISVTEDPAFKEVNPYAGDGEDGDRVAAAGR